MASDREIVVERSLDAPRELVWKAWTDPRHLAQWWGPNGFTNTIQEIDVRPGGTWRFVMHGPDGRDYRNKIVFEEVVAPERLVYSHPGDEGEPVTIRTMVIFAEVGGKTKLTMRMVFPTAAERDRVDKEYGAIRGASETVDRLERHLAHMAGAKE